jgi:phospholipid/cholesterol/gamma-HCH transport system permease protein
VSLKDRAAGWAEQLGEVGELGGRVLREVARGRIRRSALLDQIDVIGLGSIPVATLTAVFSSMVMAEQIAVQMSRFGVKEYVGSIISLSLVREIGPVLTALLVGGRVGSGIAAELGSMKVGEQLDAMRSMGADPVTELVVPRVAATVVVMPLLTAFAEVLGLAGAIVIGRVSLKVHMPYLLSTALRSTRLQDLSGGLIKTIFFGLIISLVACQHGMSTTGGTQGVGRTTIRTVVIASIATLISDFILTSVLLAFNL